MREVRVVYDINSILRRHRWINVTQMERSLGIPAGTIRPRSGKDVPEKHHDKIVEFLGRLGVLDE